MKKILCLVLSMIFVFSFAACGKKEEPEQPKHDVDIQYYVKLGKIDTIDYVLGDSVQKTQNDLNETKDDHGESNYFDFPSGEYTIMTDGGVYCCYKTDAESAGITHIVTCESAYGFEKGAVSTQVRDAMKTLGYEATEREAKQGEIFFLPASGDMTVLEYEISGNTLLFVFQEHALSATVVSKK